MSAWWLERGGHSPVPGAGRTDVPVLVGEKKHWRDFLARRRHAYTPDWTREDPRDAGVALRALILELYDPLLARLNRLPEKATIEFLNLAGISPLSGRPASAFVVFEAIESLTESVQIPQGFQLSAPAAGGGEAITFETTDAVNAVPLQITSLATGTDASIGVFAAPQGPSAAFLPFGARPRPGATWLIGVKGTAQVRDSLTLLVQAVGVEGVPAPVSTGGTEGQPSVPLPELEWEVLDGGGYTRVEPIRDESAGLMTTGLIELRAPARWRPGNPAGVNDKEPLRWLRVRLLNGDYRTPPRLALVALNAARVEAGRTINGETLTALPGQGRRQYLLSQTPIVPGTVMIEVEEGPADDIAPNAAGERFRQWKKVEDLATAQPEDRVFVVDLRTGIVMFGDDVHGKRVPEGFGNVRASSYRVGGGASGRVAAQSIATLLSSVPGIISVANPSAASGGSDGEPTAAAIRRGPEEIRSRGRAVTTADYALLACRAPGADIARAHAAAAYHASFPGARMPGVVTVFVVPTAAKEGVRPIADAETLRNVSSYLTSKVALAGVEVVAAAPTFQSVSVRADVSIRADVDPSRVARAVAAALDAHLDPIHGGADRRGWPFGGAIRHDGLVRTVLGVQVDKRAAVQSVGRLDYTVDGRTITDCADCPLLPYSLPWPESHRIRITREVR